MDYHTNKRICTETQSIPRSIRSTAVFPSLLCLLLSVAFGPLWGSPPPSRSSRCFLSLSHSSPFPLGGPLRSFSFLLKPYMEIFGCFFVINSPLLLSRSSSSFLFFVAAAFRSPRSFFFISKFARLIAFLVRFWAALSPFASLSCLPRGKFLSPFSFIVVFWPFPPDPPALAAGFGYSLGTRLIRNRVPIPQPDLYPNQSFSSSFNSRGFKDIKYYTRRGPNSRTYVLVDNFV